MAATVFSNARDGIILVDPFGRVIAMNEAFSRLTGYGRDEVLGRALNSHRMVRRLATFYAPMKNALDFHGHWSGEIQSSHKDGREMTSRISVSAVHDRHGNVQHYVALFSDMTQMKQRLQLLERDAGMTRSRSCPTACCWPSGCARRWARRRWTSRKWRSCLLTLMGSRRLTTVMAMIGVIGCCSCRGADQRNVA